MTFSIFSVVCTPWKNVAKSDRLRPPPRTRIKGEILAAAILETRSRAKPSPAFLHVDSFSEVSDQHVLVKVDNKPFDPETTVVVTNLADDGRSADIQSKDLLQEGLGIRDIPIVRSKRLGGRDQKPGIIKIEFSSLHDKIRVLRGKSNLVSKPSYKGVYIKSSNPHTERVAETISKPLWIRSLTSSDNFVWQLMDVWSR